MDVNSDKSVNAAIHKIKDEANRIDVVVNNAGYSLIGALEDLSMDEIKQQFETNLFGTIRVIKAVLLIMREQQAGTIVNVSSMAGRVGFPLFPVFSSTKFVLEGVSESLRLETDPLGIKIVLIEPGVVGSNFWNNIKMADKSEKTHSPYRNAIDKVSETFSKMAGNVISPSEVANVIVEAVTTDTPEFRYVVGEDAKMILDKNKNLSDKEFEEFIKEHFHLKY